MKYLLAILLLASASCKQPKSALPYFNTPDFTPVWINVTGAAAAKMHTIPAFSFVDQHGKQITSEEVKGKIYVADFFFTRCTGICPRMTTNMQTVAQAFANDNDVLLLSHSVTPDSDSVPVLNKYANDKKISGNWHLLTGGKAAIYDIARNGYFAEQVAGYQKDTTEFLHTENFILVDQHQHIRGIYNGTLPLEVAQLIKHIQILKEEEKKK